MRLDNWQTNLSLLIESRRIDFFELGRFDCSLWATFAIEAVNGTNLYKKYISKYKSAKGALRQLAKVDGVGSPVELFEKHLGERQPIAFAKKGDLVFTSKTDMLPHGIVEMGPVPGICYGETSFFVGEHKLLELRTNTLDFAIWVS